MNYQDFVTTMCEKVNALLDGKTRASIHNTLKMNGKERTGLMFASPGTNISPTIYLEEFYERYENGHSLDHLAESMVSLYREARFEKPWDASGILDFAHAKSKLVFRLIHLEKNKTLLCDLPHIPFMDLAVVFYLLLETTKAGSATILITKEMASSWGITEEELFASAKKNTPKLLEADFQSMADLLQGTSEESLEENPLDGCNLYVLTNKMRQFGAACLLYEHILEEIGNLLEDDYYILPSSIHELIISPVQTSPDPGHLREMIVTVNDDQVQAEEILSDHPYLYRRAEEKLLSVE